MANPAPAPTTAPDPRPAVKNTTRRGFATAAFCLGFWGTLTFWWYPFGLLVASLGVLFGLISVAMGWRAGKDGEHLAWFGILFGSIGVGMAITAYRFAQMAFEGSLPPAISTFFPWLSIG